MNFNVFFCICFLKAWIHIFMLPALLASVPSQTLQPAVLPKAARALATAPDDAPEPSWHGARAVCVSQGSTGTHGFFDAIGELHFPIAHWYNQHRARDDRLVKVRHQIRANGVFHKVGQSIFPAHEQMLARYDAAKACAAANSFTAAVACGCPEEVGQWAVDTAAAMRDVAAAGFSVSDVPYAAMPSLLAQELRSSTAHRTVFVHLKRPTQGWVEHRISRHAADGDPVCTRSMWPALQSFHSSPLDLHACARRCALHGLRGFECFTTLGSLSSPELARAYDANEALLERLFPDAVGFDFFEGGEQASKYAKASSLASAIRRGAGMGQAQGE